MRIIELMPKCTADELKQRFKEDAERFSEENDCAVRALAAVSGLSYAFVNNWLISGGYRKPRTGTYHDPYSKFLTDHGVDHRIIRTPAKTIRSFQQRRYTGKFLVRVRGHILAVIDGQAIDWADMRLHRIKQVIQIIED